MHNLCLRTSFRGQRGAVGARVRSPPLPLLKSIFLLHQSQGGRGRGGPKKSKEELVSFPLLTLIIALIASSKPPVEIPPPSDKVWVRPSRRQGGEPHAEAFGKIRLLVPSPPPSDVLLTCVFSSRNSILNQLTSEKFAQLSKQLIDLIKEEVRDMEIMKGVINILFQKALLEPGFCTMYAELCRVLERSIPPFEIDKADGGKPQVRSPNQLLLLPQLTASHSLQTFKRFLLNKCQEEFEQKPADEKDSEVTDPKAKLEQDFKRKDRMIGSMHTFPFVKKCANEKKKKKNRKISSLLESCTKRKCSQIRLCTSASSGACLGI